MTDPEPTASEEPSQTGPLTNLRGAGVSFNARRVGQVVAGLLLASLAVLAAILTVAGFHKNDQINDLRQHGVDVQITVTGCLGLLGGSGSNGAGYSCRGTFMIGGHTYTESIPGNTLREPGTQLQVVTVPGDPALLSPVATVNGEHASGRVFILPVILLAALVLLAAALLLKRRQTLLAISGRPSPPPAEPPTP
jgi:hypothetical protein